MPFRRISEVESVEVGAPFRRSLKLVLSPQEGGVQALTFLMCTIYPHTPSSLHHHDHSGELMYFVAGRGRGTLGDESFDIEPDTVLYAPPGVDHRIVNIGDEPLKIACVFVPPVPANYVESAVEAARTEAEQRAIADD